MQPVTRMHTVFFGIPRTQSISLEITLRHHCNIVIQATGDLKLDGRWAFQKQSLGLSQKGKHSSFRRIQTWEDYPCDPTMTTVQKEWQLPSGTGFDGPVNLQCKRSSPYTRTLGEDDVVVRCNYWPSQGY